MIISGKYDMLHPALVERIYKEESVKHKKPQDALKATKTRLHQMYGAYSSGSSHKKAAALLASPGDIKATATQIMQLHASTRERLPHIEEFHAFVAAHAGPAETILDLGCGFNPFSLLHMPAPPKTYYAYDIDIRTAALLNQFFAITGLPQAAACTDLAIQTPAHQVDIAYMQKLLPVLEAQAPGRGFALAREVNAKHLVITYPLKSLGGREKGMGKNYAARFEAAIVSGEMQGEIIAQENIGSELVYVILQ
ncbi:MAG: hypothetical protein FWC78_04170 [Defluviitaleaceae bacterium]|nr:hypothetical protein [Defluviitaleaceae bacterium]